MRKILSILLMYFVLTLTINFLSGGIALAIDSQQAKGQLKADYDYQGILVIQPESGYLKADWKIKVAKHPSADLRFYIRKTLENIEVSGKAIKSYSAKVLPEQPDFWSIDIQLTNDTSYQTIELSYDGVLLPEPMDNRINSITNDSVELNVDSFWHPIDATFTKQLTVSLDIRIDDNWKGVSSGDFIKTNHGLKLVNNEPAIDIPFALSTRFNISSKNGFTIYDLRETTKGQQNLVDTASFCTSYLNKLYGEKEKLPTAKLLITDRPSSGYARKSYIALTDVSETKPGPFTKFVCHEMAHFWSAGGKFDTVDNWLNEAFAEYVGVMAVRERLGIKTYEALMESFSKQIKGKQLTEIWVDGDTKRKSYLVQYRKGPLALQKLEQEIGQPLFQKFVTEYMVNRIATTPALIQTLEKVAGKKAKDYFVKLLGD